MTPSRLVAACFLVVVGAFALGAACGTSTSRTGSETNFLRRCDADCPDGLSCVCGVCTLNCTQSDECNSLGSGAECTQQPAPGDLCLAQESTFCDQLCSEDADCVPLGPSFRCQNGSCRVPDDEVLPTVCPTMTLDFGENDRSVQVGDTTRNYVVYVPENFTGTTAVPLVVDFHTLLATPANEAANSGYRELADQEGFMVAWPEGIEGAWNVGPCCTTSRDVDDVAFARALVEQVAAEACVDEKRVYATGVAMGGGMSYQVACNAADVFAAVAPSSFDLLAEEDQPCQPTRPVGVISFRGTADELVPYEGGSQPAPNPNLPGDVMMNFLGAVGTFEKWAMLDDCTGDPSAEDADGCSTYSDCADGVEVTLCTIDGGMTAWGSAEVGWAALKKHSLP